MKGMTFSINIPARRLNLQSRSPNLTLLLRVLLGEETNKIYHSYFLQRGPQLVQIFRGVKAIRKGEEIF